MVDFINLSPKTIRQISALAFKINGYVPLQKTKRLLPSSYIVNIVAKHFQHTEITIMLKTRDKKWSLPRQVVMYFLHEYTELTWQTIADKCNLKQRATAMHAYKTIQNYCDTDKVFKAKIEDIRKKL